MNNEASEPKPAVADNTALTVLDRAREVMCFDATKERLTKLAATTVDLVEITNAAGCQQIHQARMVLKSTRIAIEKTGKAARDDAVQFSKQVIKAEAELIGLISPEEERLGVIQDAWEAARKAERDEKARLEQEVATIARAKLDDLRNLPISLMAATPERLAEVIAATEAFDAFEFVGAAQAEAKQIKANTIALLQSMRAERIATLEAASVAAAAKVEADRIQKEANAAAAEVARLAKVETDRVAEELAKERKRLDEEREADRVERKRIADAAEAAQKVMDDAAKAERERLDAIAEQVRKEGEETLRKEREVFENARLEAERVARQNAIDTATLHDAATAAHSLMVVEGLGDRLETQMLAAALVRALDMEKAA